MADTKARIVLTAQDETRAAFNAVKKSLGELSASASKLAGFAGLSGLGASIAGALSGAAIGAGVKAIADGADELNKASQKYGVAVEKLSALKYAGALSDVSLEAIGTGLKKLSVNMLDTAAGTGDAKEAFKALGIEVKNADGSLKSSDEVLAEIADRFAGMEDGAGKTALAVKLFGRAGAELIPLLNQGGRGLKEMEAEARALGVVIGGDLAKKSEEFNDNLTRLSAAIDAIKISLATDLLPGLLKFTGTLIEATKASGGLWAGIKNIMNLPVTGSVFENFDVLKQKLEETDKKIAELEAKPFFLRGLNLSGLKQNRDEIVKQLEFVKEIIRLRGGGKEVFDFGPPVWEGPKNKPPALPGEKKTDPQIAEMQALGREYKQLWEAAEKYTLGLDAQIAKGRALTQSEQQLLEIERQLPAEWAGAIRPMLERADALEKQKKIMEEAKKLYEETRTPMEQLAATEAHLAELLDAGAISWDTYARAVFAAQDKLEQIKQPLDQMTEFTREAARNMQDAMADGFFDIMQGKFGDLAASFKTTIDRMVANLMASQLMNFLTGDFGRTGQMGGVLGNLFSGIFQPRALGGPVAAGMPYLVGEEGPELFVPRASGAIVPNGGMVTVYNTFTVSGAVDRRSQQQIAAEVGASVDRAMRRNR